MPINSTIKTDYEKCVHAMYLLDPTTGLPMGATATPIPVSVTLDDGWTIDRYEDTADNDSSKQWEVPAGWLWQFLWLDVTLTTSATVGNRQLELRVQRAGAVKWTTLARAGAVQAASVARYYHFAPGVADLTAFRDTDWLSTPVAVTTILQGGDTVRIWDKAAIAPAADEMYVWFQFAKKEL